MPLLALGAVTALLVTVYIYAVNNQHRFTGKRPSPRDPFNVIYLPADLEAEKKKHRSNPS